VRRSKKRRYSITSSALAINDAGIIEPPFSPRTTTYHSLDAERRPCAPQQNRVLDFRFGSKADIAAHFWDVRFTPKSGRR
jgi:hypothetical protein